MLPAKAEDKPVDPTRADQAARIEAMLKRWAAEDVSREPVWDPDAIERIKFAPAWPLADAASEK